MRQAQGRHASTLPGPAALCMQQLCMQQQQLSQQRLTACHCRGGARVQVAPYVQAVMATLLRNLESNDVQRTIKPQILSAFGDVALAIGDRFEACLPPCLHMLQSAQVCARPSLP